ncbi:LOW QUALITY PROTEIN: hypothetical protein SETIT_3G104600v2 [Setaria italica]|uniref:Uncharacterized protein n=1 Tax=Setaria italica TaxID=4555 RepID=A0A368QFI4_SETIT|nr:LOW QUALITY PROTEIN: hypothetical protein SETIT_3G104600v2 [Setaria italica]
MNKWRCAALAVHVHHGVVEGGDAVGRHALRDEPCPWLVGPGLDEDARGDAVQVCQRHHVGRRAPPVVHLGEAQPRPVRHQQRPVVGGDLVRVAGLLPGRPARELRREPLLPLPDDLYHVGDGRRGHLPRRGGDAHDVVAVAVEADAGAREAGGEERSRVHGEAEVDGGVRVERRGAGAALPCLGDEHLERGAAAPARGRGELGLEVVDVVGGDVDGQVLEALDAVQLGEAADVRTAGSGMASRSQRNPTTKPTARERRHLHASNRAPVSQGGGNLESPASRPNPAQCGSNRDEASAYLDEQDELVLLLVAGPWQRVREELVLGDLERVLEVVDVLEPAPHGGLDEPDALAAAVDVEPAGVLGHGEATRERVVLDERPREGPLDGLRRADPVARRVGLEDVQRLDERHLGRRSSQDRRWGAVGVGSAGGTRRCERRSTVFAAAGSMAGSPEVGRGRGGGRRERRAGVSLSLSLSLSVYGLGFGGGGDWWPGGWGVRCRGEMGEFVGSGWAGGRRGASPGPEGGGRRTATGAISEGEAGQQSALSSVGNGKEDYKDGCP